MIIRPMKRSERRHFCFRIGSKQGFFIRPGRKRMEERAARKHGDEG